MVETFGGEALNGYDQKVTCCGGALAFSEPEKSKKQIKDIVESAYDHGAEMIVTPCPLCQANVEIYQGDVNKRYGTKFNIPVLYYSQLMTLAYGGSAKEAGLNGELIKATKLEAFAAKKEIICRGEACLSPLQWGGWLDAPLSIWSLERDANERPQNLGRVSGLGAPSRIRSG